MSTDWRYGYASCTHISFPRLLKDVAVYIQKQCTFGFFKLLLLKNERLAAIDAFHRRISSSVSTFHVWSFFLIRYNCLKAERYRIAALIDTRLWQSRNEEARKTDQGRLHTHLRHLEANQRLLIEALGSFGLLPIFHFTCVNLLPFVSTIEVPRNSSKAMIATLQRRVTERKGDQEEIRFLKHSLRYLSSVSAQEVEVHPWTITTYDVEVGPLIECGC